jgi:hypothetical protein
MRARPLSLAPVVLVVVLGAHTPASLASASLGRVWVVDAASGPGTDFTTIQAAVDAAVDGESVLVRPGTYASFAIVGKDVDVVADGGPVTVAGFELRDLASSGSIVVRGLQSTGVAGPGAAIVDCAGHVLVEACTLVGADGDGVFVSPNFDPSGAPGAFVDGSTRVAFARSTLRGGDGDDYVPLTVLFGAGGDGLRAVGSFVALYTCTALGGDGGDVADDDAAWTGGAGGDGIEIDAGFLFVSGGSATGGDGGRGGEDFDGFTGSYTCGNGGPGGDGLRQSSPSIGPVAVQLLAVVTNGGAGGPPYFGAPCASGADGEPVDVDPAALLVLQQQFYRFRATSPVREGGTVDFVFGGEPGAFVVLGLATQPFFAPAAFLNGVLLVDPSAQVLLPGLLDGNGALTTALTANLAVPALSGLTVHAQPLFVSPLTQEFVLGPASSVLVLDANL